MYVAQKELPFKITSALIRNASCNFHNPLQSITYRDRMIKAVVFHAEDGKFEHQPNLCFFKSFLKFNKL